MHVRAYSYINSWGSNLRKVSEHAVLNANYLQSLLKDTFELAYDRRCAHEFVLSSKKFGEKSALNIAKRLMDYGFHPPTIYFPLVVHEALMIEPTETESKETLDKFAVTLKKIASEIKESPEVVRQSPLTTPVGSVSRMSAPTSTPPGRRYDYEEERGAGAAQAGDGEDHPDHAAEVGATPQRRRAGRQRRDQAGRQGRSLGR